MTAHLLYFLSICFILWFVYPAPPSLIIQRNYCFVFIWRRRDIAVDSLITMMISIFLCLFDVPTASVESALDRREERESWMQNGNINILSCLYSCHFWMISSTHFFIAHTSKLK